MQSKAIQYKAFWGTRRFAAACVYEAVMSIDINKYAHILKICAGVYTVFFVGLLFFFVIPACHARFNNVASIMDSEWLRTVLSCLAVLLLAVSGESKFTGFLSCRIFKTISNLSFGIYLIHFFFLGYFNRESLLHNVIVNFFISFCIAYFIHDFIEAPLARRGKTA